MMTSVDDHFLLCYAMLQHMGGIAQIDSSGLFSRHMLSGDAAWVLVGVLGSVRLACVLC